MVCVSATIASLLFAAATMGWFRARCTWFEIGLLLVATFLFFRPDWVIDRFYAKYTAAPAQELIKIADSLRTDEWLVLRIQGDSVEGEKVTKTVALPMGEGANGRERIRNAGVTLAGTAKEPLIANVKFGSRARKLGIEQGYKIVELKLPNRERPSPYWVFILAVLLAAFIWFLQKSRVRRAAAA